jgi:hypothetical protein
MRTFATAIVLVLTMMTSSVAQPMDCTKALIPATTNITYDQITNFSLAYTLTESAYNQAKQQFGANAVVYGIPLGASYGSYHSNAEQRAKSLHIQNFQQLAYSYATSGINSEGLEAYKACLLQFGGLQLVAGKPGSNHYAIWLMWVPPLNARAGLTGQASARNVTQADFQSYSNQVKQVNFGQRVELNLTLEPQSNTQESTISIRVGNTSRSLVLPPLLAFPAPTPPELDVTLRLIGTYQVMLGPRGGCNGGKAGSYPSRTATISSDGTNITAYNECGTPTSVRIAPDKQAIYFFGEHAALDFSAANPRGVGLVIKADDGNSWQKVQ